MSKIGEGSYGRIYKVLNYESGKEYALKVMAPKDDKDKAHIERETGIMQMA